MALGSWPRGARLGDALRSASGDSVHGCASVPRNCILIQYAGASQITAGGWRVPAALWASSHGDRRPPSDASNHGWPKGATAAAARCGPEVAEPVRTEADGLVRARVFLSWLRAVRNCVGDAAMGLRDSVNRHRTVSPSGTLGGLRSVRVQRICNRAAAMFQASSARTSSSVAG